MISNPTASSCEAYSSSVEGAPRQRVAILGCTGSIGAQALDVCRQHADRLQVVALSAHSRTEELVRAAREFTVPIVAVTDPAHAEDSCLSELPEGTKLLVGESALEELAVLPEADTVLVSVVGAVGLRASYAVLKAGKRLALANKESLVVGGDLLMPLAQPGQLLPVDSEHSAIFQCLLGERAEEIHCIWLTCSGGPFFGRNREELEGVTRAQALAHPTWNMGAKITIDSATLMNKGFERIEAAQLFGLPMERIPVLIQRESRVHSMVEYVDGAVIAHLGASDMRLPIQYALSYPERWETPAERIDFRTIGSLTFDAPDPEAFRCLALAEEAGRTGGTAPCVLNAANEVAVAAFLAESCSFTAIDACVAHCLELHDARRVESLEQLHDIDRWARAEASCFLAGLS